MKRIIFLLIILGCLLFCGCAATADIEYGIDADNNAYTKLRVDVKTTDLDEKSFLQSSLRQVGEYYRDELGFEYEGDFFKENENSAYILLTKLVPADNFEQAFESLKEMLCDEKLTVFSELSCELSDTATQYAYRIKGRADLYKSFEIIYNSGITKGTAEYIASLLESCSFSATLSLPQNTRIYRLSHTEPTEISHEGKVFAPLGTPWEPLMTEKAGAYFKVFLWGFGAFAVLSITGMIIGITLIKKGKSKARPSPSNQIPQNGEETNDQEEDKDPL